MPETTGLLGGVLPVPQIPQIPGLPSISVPRLAAGRSTAPAAGWVYVRYTDAVLGGNLSYTKPPTLLVVAEGRSGWFTPRTFAAPSIAIQLPGLQLPPIIQVPVPSVPVTSVLEVPPFSLPSASVSSIAIPSITLPSVSITVPRVAIGTPVLSIDTIREFVYNTYPFTADWYLLNWIKDALKEAVSQFLYWFWTKTGQPLISKTVDGVQVAVNSALGNAQTSLNDGLKKMRDNTQVAISSLINDANAKVAALKDSINAGLKTITDGANQNIEKFRVNVNASIAAVPTGVQRALDSFGTGIAGGVNNAFTVNRQQLQQALDSYRLSIQQQVNGGLATVSGFATQALNSVIPQLWALLGLPANAVFVPVFFIPALDGFKWYAPAAGVTVHYAGIGT